MKNFLRLSFIFAIIFNSVSCNEREDENLIQEVTRVEIDSITVQTDTMSLGTKLSFKTYSNYVSKCEGFYGYDYVYTNDFTRTVTSYKFKTSVACGEPTTRFSLINFRPQKAGNYLFRFFKRKNDAGQTEWIEKRITVN